VGRRAAPRPSTPPASAEVPAGQAVLASWRHLLDTGRLQDGEPFLANTAKTPVARLSPNTAAEIGLAVGGLLSVRGLGPRCTCRTR
jgi:NADH-quinone oxidoreductase subunit G